MAQLAPAEEDRLVAERIEQLLASHDPTSTDESTFWGAQFDHGLAWVQFPEGLGGLEVRPGLQEVVTRALSNAGAPSNFARNGIGVGMAAPVINAFASDDLKKRLLRPLYACEEIWCQMFSEPGAGSDVAGLSTQAVRDGDEWVVNGQKVWTTLAHLSRWGLLVARTDPNVPKHNGLTYFIVDMHAPGVEVRPLRQMTGDAEFNEVYFTDARIPDSMRLGEVGDGWRVAVATLMNERSAIGQAVELWQKSGDTDAATADRVVSLWVEAELVRLTTVRAQQKRAVGTPGPEESIGKLASSELAKKVNELCVDLLGPEGLLYPSYEMVRPTSIGEGSDDPTKSFLRSRANTIEGGTSEIMRNILGERILGLPGEPRVDRDLPWSQVPRS